MSRCLTVLHSGCLRVLPAYRLLNKDISPSFIGAFEEPRYRLLTVLPPYRLVVLLFPRRVALPSARSAGLLPRLKGWSSSAFWRAFQGKMGVVLLSCCPAVSLFQRLVAPPAPRFAMYIPAVFRSSLQRAFRRTSYCLLALLSCRPAVSLSCRYVESSEHGVLCAI